MSLGCGAKVQDLPLRGECFNCWVPEAGSCLWVVLLAAGTLYFFLMCPHPEEPLSVLNRCLCGCMWAYSCLKQQEAWELWDPLVLRLLQKSCWWQWFKDKAHSLVLGAGLMRVLQMPLEILDVVLVSGFWRVAGRRAVFTWLVLDVQSRSVDIAISGWRRKVIENVGGQVAEVFFLNLSFGYKYLNWKSNLNPA